MNKKPERNWHVDRTIPLALILAIGAQTGTAIWWARGLEARVDDLEKANESRADQVSQLNSIAVDIAVLKENVKTTKDDISSMKSGFEMLMQQVLQGSKRR
jgi:cell division protein FtsB